MAVRICYKIAHKDENGNAEYFGLSVEMDGVELKEDATYEQLGAIMDKQKIIDAVCLTEIITPGQMELISPEEYDENFGDDEEPESDA